MLPSVSVDNFKLNYVQFHVSPAILKRGINYGEFLIASQGDEGSIIKGLLLKQRIIFKL